MLSSSRLLIGCRHVVEQSWRSGRCGPRPSRHPVERGGVRQTAQLLEPGPACVATGVRVDVARLLLRHAHEMLVPDQLRLADDVAQTFALLRIGDTHHLLGTPGRWTRHQIEHPLGLVTQQVGGVVGGAIARGVTLADLGQRRLERCDRRLQFLAPRCPFAYPAFCSALSCFDRPFAFSTCPDVPSTGRPFSDFPKKRRTRVGSEPSTTWPSSWAMTGADVAAPGAPTLRLRYTSDPTVNAAASIDRLRRSGSAPVCTRTCPKPTPDARSAYVSDPAREALTALACSLDPLLGLRVEGDPTEAIGGRAGHAANSWLARPRLAGRPMPSEAPVANSPGTGRPLGAVRARQRGAHRSHHDVGKSVGRCLSRVRCQTDGERLAQRARGSPLLLVEHRHPVHPRSVNPRHGGKLPSVRHFWMRRTGNGVRGASPGIRTQNQWIKSPLLCH